MDFPLLLAVLLALPFAAAAVIIAVSAGRRRRHAHAGDPDAEPVHRGQADPAAVQSARVSSKALAKRLTSGRERRAGAAGKQTPR